MVKGNWERRAEIGLLRRKEEKERKAAKKAGVKSASAVAASLLARDSSSELTNLESLQCFCFSEEEEAAVCSEYLRAGECSHAGKKGDKKKDKKERACKWGHDTECLRDVLDKVEMQAETDTEPRIVGPFDLRMISSKRHRQIAFIGVNGECVYDHLNPFLWVGSKFNIAKARAGSVTSEVSEPGDDDKEEKKEEDDEEEEKLGVGIAKCPAGDGGEGGEVSGDTAVLRDLLFKVTRKCPEHLGSFLSDEEVAWAKEVSKPFKEMVNSSALLRGRIREARSAKSGILCKKKKEEKKKSKKAANVSSKAKIDGFARGGATGS